jgi:hypothetical protein
MLSRAQLFAAASPMRDAMMAALAGAGVELVAAGPADLLINADPAEAARDVIARAQNFAACLPVGQPALVVNLLHAGSDWAAAELAATLWGFTRHAALAWAPRGVRVNAIGLGVSPLGPFEPMEAAGNAAGNAPAAPATPEDVARTVLAMLGFDSMTGQIIRLGV